MNFWRTVPKTLEKIPTEKWTHKGTLVEKNHDMAWPQLDNKRRENSERDIELARKRVSFIEKKFDRKKSLKKRG